MEENLRQHHNGKIILFREYFFVYSFLTTERQNFNRLNNYIRKKTFQLNLLFKLSSFDDLKDNNDLLFCCIIQGYNIHAYRNFCRLKEKKGYGLKEKKDHHGLKNT